MYGVYPSLRSVRLLLVAMLSASLPSLCSAQTRAGKIEFSRDIQPILAGHCFSCHGVDESSRKGELRLDFRDISIAKKAIVPGDTNSSELVARIFSSDPDLQMPPPESKKALSATQKELLKRWIADGAAYQTHWAFVSPVRPKVPSVKQTQWPRNAIDNFVLERLESEGHAPSKEADQGTLLRRVTLDLSGLPPTDIELKDFLSDPSESAYEKVVDRLLASQHYAERMAMPWLDIARYADTNGYNNDEDRSMWPWRDWVIRAFDQNLPYDQFILEQLAGDLLPNPTQDQLVATGFLRNQGHNTEGGIIVEEYRIEYVADRVHTTATAFLGLSMQCARCHEHKFDPISQREYYQFFSFFNNLEEKQASYSKFVAAEPYIRVPSKEQAQKMTDLDQQIQQLERQIEQCKSTAEANLDTWAAKSSQVEIQSVLDQKLVHHLQFEESPLERIDDTASTWTGKVIGNAAWKAGKVGQAIELDGKSHVELRAIDGLDSGNSLTITAWIFPTASENMAIVSKMDEAANFRGFDLLLDNGKLTSHFINKWPDNGLKVTTKKPLTLNAWHHVALTYDGTKAAGSIKIFVDGKSQELEILNNNLTESFANQKTLHVGLREKNLPYRGLIDDLCIYQGQLQPDQVSQLFQGQAITSLASLLRIAKDQRTPEQSTQLQQIYLAKLDTQFADAEKQLAVTKKSRLEVEEQSPAVMIMKEMPNRRETFVLRRGQYDQPLEKVATGVPAALLPSGMAMPTDRLALAKWLIDPRHPLTARVAVNRWWESYFGTGLVRTSEDFGTTGEPPTHPELLDYLATFLIENQWNVKALQKLIVMSATYRQDSAITDAWLAVDPENRLLGRGPRFRMSAELIRDNALSISGLMSDRVGGPSVKPYQPDGLWEDVTVERRGKYVADQGEGLYRRSMYSFWKRTCPPPSMMSFDAPNREVCLVRRARTNTPLQSLILMNDVTYIEAARALAEKMIQEGGNHTTDRIQVGFRRCLARTAKADELATVEGMLAEAVKRFTNDPSAAKELNAIGNYKADASLNPADVAAWTIVASTLLNLDETITKK